MSEITVTISGPVGCGKSAIAGEIEIALKAIGVPVRYADKKAARSEKNMTGADWTSYLEMYQPNVVLVEQINPAEPSPMEAYALEVTKALTGLAGGGSEMFSERIGGIFKADIDKCCQVVRDRHAKTHEWMIRAVKEKIAAEAQSEAMAKALEWFLENDETNRGDTPMPERGGMTWDEINAYWIEGVNAAERALASYRNREGNGNAL